MYISCILKTLEEIYVRVKESEKLTTWAFDEQYFMTEIFRSKNRDRKYNMMPERVLSRWNLIITWI